MGRKCKDERLPEPAAGNGILNRRIFLERSLIAGAAGLGAGALSPSGALAEPLTVPRWSKEPGGNFTAYGQPSHYEDKVARTWAPPNNPATPGIGSSRTPHHLLDGTITPSGLHYERSHSGVPDIDPEQHRLVIHGLVRQPLIFSLEDLSRYPRVSRIAFLECAGNSGALYTAQARPLDVQAIRPVVVLGLDRGQALDAPRRGRHRSARQVGAGRGRRRLRHEPQLPARQGDG
jgi:sulfane dehydrogenase subunit SoxC